MNIYKSRLDYILSSLFRLLTVYILFLGLFTIFRLAYTFYYGTDEVLSTFKSDLLTAFFVGWKYDNIVISYLALPAFLLLTTVSLFKNLTLYNLVNKILFIYFFFAFILCSAVLIADFGFYSFYQDHINIIFFGIIEDDTTALFKSVWDNYPLGWTIIGVGVIFVCLFLVLRKIFKKLQRQGSLVKENISISLLLIIVSFFALAGGLRGGYGDLVLAPKYSEFSENDFINSIALNGVIALEKSYKLRKERESLDFNLLDHFGYGKNYHKAFSDYLGFDVSPTKESALIELIKRETPKNEIVEKEPPHVIVFLMESFGSSWNQYNSDSFNILGELKDYFDKGIYFNNIVSSDNGTIGSLLTLTTNIPHRSGARYLPQSRYMRVPLESGAHIPYKQNGYETNFIYGGKLGWRDIGKYYTVQEYDHVIGESRLKNELGLKGDMGTEWGVYDEYLFEYILKQIKSNATPQFFFSLTTTNHPPFRIPKGFNTQNDIIIPEVIDKRISRERGLFIDRFRAFQYSNKMLASFLKKIEESELKDKVIVAVTGDHNFWGFLNYNQSEGFSKFKVPFYIYASEKYLSKKHNPSRIGSHEDIMTTLYNFTLSKTSFISFGEDLLSSEKSYALNSSVLAGDEGVILKGKNFLWKNKDKSIIETKEFDGEFKELQLRYKSSLGIGDYYLRSKIKEK